MNPHVIDTRPSNVRVCQFRHSDTFLESVCNYNINKAGLQGIISAGIVSTHCREKIISPILKGRPLEITFILRCYGVVDNEPPPT